jgi:long-chain acyl-CoA synthetase
MRVERQECLPSGQVLLAPTHGSLLDPFVLGAALDRGRLEHTLWAGDVDWAFGNPFSRTFSRLARVIPVDVRHGFISAMALAAAVLKRGESLIWFPEGQRARRAEVQEFMPGIGLLLERFDVPVVPVAIHGAHEAFPPGRILPRPGRIRVIFGEPLDRAQLEKEGRGDQPMDRITSALHRRTVELYRQTRPSSPR